MTTSRPMLVIVLVAWFLTALMAGHEGMFEAAAGQPPLGLLIALVAPLVFDAWRRRRYAHGLTIGIVAFSEAQQNEIEDALNRLAREDADFREKLDAELEREEDGQFAGLLVKNLENIQGDERDIVLLSVCYGYNASGKMLMNFGPINQTGGEKRLNVAFSRAKKHMAIVSSIRHADITNHPRVVGVETPVGGQVERHTQSFLAGLQIASIEGIALFRCGESRVLTNRPRSTHIHC